MIRGVLKVYSRLFTIRLLGRYFSNIGTVPTVRIVAEQFFILYNYTLCYFNVFFILYSSDTGIKVKLQGLNTCKY